MTSPNEVTPHPEAAHNGSHPAPRNDEKKGAKSLPAKAGPVKPDTTKPDWHIHLLPVERIEPNPYQPRQSFDPAEMEDLKASVRVHGVQQPIIVRTCKADIEALKVTNGSTNGQSNGHANGHSNGLKANGSKTNGAKTNGHKLNLHKPKVKLNLTNVLRYQLVIGERRLRASKEAGRKTIPAIIRDDLTDAQAAELALLENIQRSNLTVIEEAAGYKRLMLEFRMKEERIAKKVGKSVQTIRETIKLLQLPQGVQTLLAQKKLTAAHGRELLHFAAFERLCLMVAERVVRDHLSALSLQATPLPNVQELKGRGLLVELDFRTQFDWKDECVKCPFKAYLRSGYSSYCLKPDEWKKKQEMAAELKKQEAAQIMEAARQDGKTSVETYKLPQGSYRDLTYATLPAGCSAQCACRGESCDPNDPTKKRPICLDPQKFKELVEAERQAHEEARKRRYTALWDDAVGVLRAEFENQWFPKTAALLSLPVLAGHTTHYRDPESWQALVRGVGEEMGVDLAWDEFFGPRQDEDDLLRMLERALSENEARRDLEGITNSEPGLDPHCLVLWSSSLLLAQEARDAISFGGETPLLHFVLGLQDSVQPELEAPDGADETEDADIPCPDIEITPESHDSGLPSGEEESSDSPDSDDSGDETMEDTEDEEEIQDEEEIEDPELVAAVS